MDLHATFERARGLVTRQGLRGIGTHLVRRLLTTVPSGESRRLLLFVLSKPRPSKSGVEAARGHTFRYALRDDVVALRGNPSSGIQDRDLSSFDVGNKCLLQLDGTKLVGYSWIAESRLIELMWGFHFNLPDDMAYNYNGFTAPEYRGKSFQGLRHLKVLEHVRERGQTRLFGYVDHLNYPSLSGVKKSGYEEIGVVRAVKRGGRVGFDFEVADHSWSQRVRIGPLQR